MEEHENGAEAMVLPEQRRVDNLDILLQITELKGDLRAHVAANQTAHEQLAKEIETERSARTALTDVVTSMRLQWAKATGIGAIAGAVAAATLAPIVSRYLT